MLDFALNQVTMSTAPLGEFLETAAGLGCVGVELRNDLGRKVFDGMDPADAGALVRAHGLRLLGVSQVYPFNRWSDAIATEVISLIETAGAAGAETISLIPCNDGTGTDPSARGADLANALEHCLPMLERAGMLALVEPLGFERASLREKSELVAAIDKRGAGDRIKLVHDTFHHALSGGGPIFADRTGIVHISGVTDATLPVERFEDEHRVLVDGEDRLDNLGQIKALTDAGYAGVFSFECFAPEVRDLADPAAAIRRSIDFISSQLRRTAA